MASQSAAVHKSAAAEIRVQPINGFIGAEIEGVDLRRPLSPAQFKIGRASCRERVSFLV